MQTHSKNCPDLFKRRAAELSAVVFELPDIEAAVMYACALCDNMPATRHVPPWQAEDLRHTHTLQTQLKTMSALRLPPALFNILSKQSHAKTFQLIQGGILVCTV